MKNYKIVIALISSILLAFQNNQNQKDTESENPSKVINPNGSVWTNIPMEEFPECIDSLKFEETTVFVYSCEHESEEEHKYEIKGDSIYIEKWNVINEADSTTELSAKEWYKLTQNGLVWVKVKRKRGVFFGVTLTPDT